MINKTTLEQWQVLQAVIEKGGYAQAADYLHKSQSSISYTLAKLQQQLGLELLTIKGRKAVLTDTGTAMMRRSRLLLEDAQQLEQLGQNLQQGWEPEINLVVDAAFPTDMLMRALKHFAPISSGTRVQLNEVVLSGAQDALINGTTDLAITTLVPDNVLANPLISIEFIAVAHPRHALHQIKHPLESHHLLKELQVVIRDSSFQQRQDKGWLAADHRWTVSSIETAITTVCEGLGFCWLPRQRIKQQLLDRQLKPLALQQGKSYFVMLYLVLAQAESAGPASKKLADLLQQVAQE